MKSQEDLPRTRAELSDYRETSTHEDVLRFIDELTARTDRVRRVTLGRSGEGRDMVALVVSDGACFTPEEAREQGRLVVMIEANIHAGEVEGKESVLALARDLTCGGAGKKLLSKICLVILPNFNPDGNDRISPENRRLDLAHLEGQVNPPGGVGTRYTGEGWNLNRDAMKQEAVETRNLAAFFGAWWPHVFIDCHTTDGSIHAFDLTFDTSGSNQRLFRRLRAKASRLLEAASARIERRHGFRSTWYGNFVDENDPTSGWQTYPGLPRFGSHYRGLLGRIDILLETYSYLDFPRRCEVMYAWLSELVRRCARDAKALVRAVEREEKRIIRRGKRYDPRPRVGVNYGVARRDEAGALRFDYPAHESGSKIQVITYDQESITARRYPGAEEVEHRVPFLHTFIPTIAVSTPIAYLAPAQLADALKRHGIAFEKLEEEEAFDAESYVILALEKTHSPDVAGVVPPLGKGEVPLSAEPPPRRFETVLSVRPEQRRVTMPRGALYVPTAQRSGTLAVYLMEPHSDDGFARWEVLDKLLDIGGLFPIHRLVRAPAPRRVKQE